MTLKYNLVITTLIVINNLYACDFCGCFMGITPYDNQSSIAVLYRYKSFSGYPFGSQNNYLFPASRNYSIRNANGLRHGAHQTGSGASVIRLQSDYEIYTTAEIRAKYFIHQRIEINAIVPYIMNYNRVNEKKQTLSEIGDIHLFAAYHLISKILTENYQHRLIVGGGVKLPVGHYYMKDENNQRIDYLLQPGTGSVDYMAYANYVFGYKKMGINFNSTYKFNGENYYHEQIANSTTTTLNLFYKFRQDKDFKIFPSLQGYYEYSDGLYINSVYQDATTMSIANAGVGLDMFYKNFALNMSFQLPVYEKKYNSNMMQSCRAMVGLTFGFNQLKYLIKPKKSEIQKEDN